MKYRTGYDGQVAEDFTIQLPPELHPEEPIETEFLQLDTTGLLTIFSGYSWDFASVPLTHWLSNKIQGRRSKTPSLIHDSLCQLYRQGHLKMPGARQHADKFFYKLLLERGFWKFRAWAWSKAVLHWGKRNKQEPKQILEAP